MKKAFLYIILAGILWGTSGLFVNVLAPMGLTSLQMTAIRGTVSAVCMSVYVFFSNKKLFRVNSKELFLYAMGGIAIFGTSASYFFSMQASSVATAVVLMYTAPVIVMVYSTLFLGEKFTKKKCLSLVLVMAGACLVSGIIGGFRYSAEGIFFGFVAGIAYSSYNIVAKIQMKNKCNPVTANMYVFIFMCIVSLAFSKPMEIIEVAQETDSAIWYMILCGLCTCIAPYFLYSVALKYLPVGTAASLAIIEPMSATLMSIAFLGETMNLTTFVGIVLILTAVVVLSTTSE